MVSKFNSFFTRQYEFYMNLLFEDQFLMTIPHASSVVLSSPRLKTVHTFDYLVLIVIYKSSNLIPITISSKKNDREQIGNISQLLQLGRERRKFLQLFR